MAEINIFGGRPFALSCFSFVLSGLLMSYTPLERYGTIIIVISAATLVAAFLVALFRRNIKLVAYFVFPLFAFNIGIAEFCYYFENVERQILEYSGENISIEADIVKRVYSGGFSTGFEIETREIDGKPAKLKMFLESPYASDVQEGFRIRTTVNIGKIENTSSFDRENYYAAKGIYLSAEESGENYEVISEDIKIPFGFFKDLNRYLVGIFNNQIGGSEAGFISALFLGDRGGLEDEVKRDFSRSGIYHLLSLSGQHLSVLTASVEKLMKMLKMKKGVRYAILSILVLFYSALTGFGSSVMRAAIMLLCSYLAYYLRSERDAFTALSFSVALICFVSPSSVFDTGLWLSAISTLALICVTLPGIKWENETESSPNGEKVGGELKPVRAPAKFSKTRKLASASLRVTCTSLLTSFAAAFATLPIEWLSFGKLSIIGAVATLVLAPFITLILNFAPIFIILSFIGLSADTMIFPLRFLADASMEISSFISNIPNIEISLKHRFVSFVLIPILIFIALFLVLRFNKGAIPAVAIIMSVLIAGVCYYFVIDNSRLSVDYMSLKKNEYFCVSAKGKNILIDISDGTYTGLSDAAKEMTDNGYCETDILLLTHYHTRHASSVERLISSRIVRSVWLPEPVSEQERQIATDIYERCKDFEVDVTMYADKSELTLCESETLRIYRKYIFRSTHPVLVLDFEGDIDITYLGSSFDDAKIPIMASEYTIVGQHGPICKNEYEILNAEAANVISFANENLLDFLGEKTRSKLSLADNVKYIINTQRLHLTP